MSAYNKVIHVELKGNYKLVVYEFKYGLRGDLFVLDKDSKGYDLYRKISSSKFYFKNNDATLYRVKEYFGF